MCLRKSVRNLDNPDHYGRATRIKSILRLANSKRRQNVPVRWWRCQKNFRTLSYTRWSIFLLYFLSLFECVSGDYVIKNLMWKKNSTFGFIIKFTFTYRWLSSVCSMDQTKYIRNKKIRSKEIKLSIQSLNKWAAWLKIHAKEFSCK